MATFNSLGSNYVPKDAWRTITALKSHGISRLQLQLKNRYSREVLLTYKGREALFIAIRNLGLDEGSIIAVNGYTCYAVYDAIRCAGCVPHYLDVEKKELNYSAKTLEDAIKKEDIQAVIIQNTLGTPSDSKGIKKLCRKNRIPLIEDLAHSIGMQYEDGSEAGTVGEYAALSFSQDKVLDAVSGGALLHDSKINIYQHSLGYVQRIKDFYYIINTLIIRMSYDYFVGKAYNKLLASVRALPRPMDGEADELRILDDWHANLALRRLSKLDSSIAHRQKIAEIYRSNLPKSVQIQHFDTSIYLRFPILVKNRKSLIRHLASLNIHVSDIWYESVVSPKRMQKDAEYVQGTCENAEQIAKRMVNLPTHINVDEDEAHIICNGVNEWLSKQEK